MRLKILVMPFSILFSLIVVIGFVKPDITVLQDKRVVLDTKTSQSQGMTTLLTNIASLTSSLDDQPESEKLVSRYLAQELDQERIVDMFNYLAAQSGVFVSSMSMKETVVKSPKEEQISPDTGLPIATSTKPKVKAYVTMVEVKGGYEGIKDFMSRVSHMNRYHKILDFSIESAGGDTEAEAGVLIGRLQTQFDYFPLQKLDSALNVPIFLRGEFDSTQLTSLLNWVNHTVPPLMSPDAGKANPFQR